MFDLFYKIRYFVKFLFMLIELIINFNRLWKMFMCEFFWVVSKTSISSEELDWSLRRSEKRGKDSSCLLISINYGCELL